MLTRKHRVRSYGRNNVEEVKRLGFKSSDDIEWVTGRKEVDTIS